MTRTSIVSSLVIALTLGLVGCKGDKVIQPDPQTKAELDQCLKDKAEKDKLIKAEEEENARLMREKGKRRRDRRLDRGQRSHREAGSPRRGPPDRRQGGGRGVEGVPQRRGQIARRDPEVLRAGAQEEHRASGQDGHAVGVGELRASGQFKSSNFRAIVGDAFDSCIRTVASKWTLPTSSPAMTFKAQVSLTPS